MIELIENIDIGPVHNKESLLIRFNSGEEAELPEWHNEKVYLGILT